MSAEPTLTELLARQLGMTPDQLREAQLQAKQELADEQSGRKRPVIRSRDFERIAALPARHWDAFQTEECRDAVTQACKTPTGTMRVNPLQAAAVMEMQRANGLVGMIHVGGGKTLISYLAGSVLNAKKCVLLVPPDLLEKTKRDFDELRKHWVGMDVSGLYIISYSTLSSIKNGDILDRIEPDLLICEEASALKNPASARTKRVARYIRKHKPKVVLLSGTLTRRKLRELVHFLVWVFGEEHAPIPTHYPTVLEWGEAVDAMKPDEEYLRRDPGVLEYFRLREEDKPTDLYRNRLISTLGVVSSISSRLPVDLQYNIRPLKLSAKVEEAVKELHERWERPDGESFSDILELARVDRELSCGFWNKWMWPLDEDGRPVINEAWMKAKAAWNKAVREKLRHATAGMDSPKLLEIAAMKSLWKTPAWEPWAAVKAFKAPETVAQWVDDSFMVDDAIAWGREAPGIIWVTHIALGEKIAEKSGFPYYGEGKEASQLILDEKGNRTIIASVQSHQKGKNLQHAFWRNLITTPMASGEAWEQVVARTHREGQPSDIVMVDIYMHTDSFKNSFTQAWVEAKYMNKMQGEQKLIYGLKTFEGFN